MKTIFNIISLIFIITFSTSLYADTDKNNVKPFGQGIFQNTLTSTQPTVSNPNLKINYGDKLLLRMWGSKNIDIIMTVDADGTVFIPDVGPVTIIGDTLKNAQEKIQKSIKGIYKDTVNIHTTISETKPLSVFVTGFVNNPGRYEGHQSDTILDFLSKAGGIDPQNGSFREIIIKRDNDIIKNYDLYDFLLKGELTNFQFKANDTIFVGTKKTMISITSDSDVTSYEFNKNKVLGNEIITLLKINKKFSHAKITDQSDTNKSDVYLQLSDFKNFELEDGDNIIFVEDKSSNTMSINVEGSVIGQSNFNIKRNSTLKEILSFIEVDTTVSNIEAIYIKRDSVAQAQKNALDKNLNILQQKVLKSQTQSPTEANIRAKEAEMILGFIEKAKLINPSGTIVVTNNGKINDIHLKEGDIIVIPDKTDVILVSGEVLSPNAFIYDKNLKAHDYINRTGSISELGDKDSILITHANGDVTKGTLTSQIKQGDQILVMPKIDTKTFAFSQDIVGLIYQIAVSSNILLSL